MTPLFCILRFLELNLKPKCETGENDSKETERTRKSFYTTQSNLAVDFQSAFDHLVELEKYLISIDSLKNQTGQLMDMKGTFDSRNGLENVIPLSCQLLVGEVKALIDGILLRQTQLIEESTKQEELFFNQKVNF
jgi:hypothetical protein